LNENRTVYPKKKVEMYQQLQELPNKYKVLAVVNLEKVRASQLLPLRKKLGDDVKIFSIKNKIAKKALEKLDVKGIEKTVERLKGQCLFLFTNMSPFKLNVLLGKNKVMLAARGGDIASMDEADLATNASTIISAIEKKLPNGEKNIKKIMIKTTMGKAVKLEDGKK